MAIDNISKQYIQKSQDYYFGNHDGEHYGCSIAIAKAFDSMSPGLHSLRRGGLDGSRCCGAIAAAEMILAHIFGPAEDNESVSPKLMEIIIAFRRKIDKRLSTKGSYICNNLVSEYQNFDSISRFNYCGNIVRQTAAALIETIDEFDGKIVFAEKDKSIKSIITTALEKNPTGRYPLYIHSKEERYAWLQKGADMLLRPSQHNNILRLHTGLSCFSHSDKDVATNSRQTCYCKREQKLISKLVKNNITVRCMLTPRSNLLIQMGYSAKELQLRFQELIKFLDNDTLDKSFTFTAGDSPQPQLYIFGANVYLESYKAMVGAGYEVALVRTDNNEIADEIKYFDNKLLTQAAEQLDEKFTFTPAQNKALRQGMISKIKHQYSIVKKQNSRPLRNNIHQINKQKKISAEIILNQEQSTDNSYSKRLSASGVHSNVYNKFIDDLDAFTSQVQHLLKAEHISLYLKHEARRAIVYSSFQMPSHEADTLILNNNSYLTEYLVRTGNILVFSEIPSYAKYYQNGIPKNYFQAIKKAMADHSISLLIPVISNNELLGVIAAINKQSSYNVQDIMAIKKIVMHMNTYIKNSLMYLWAVTKYGKTRKSKS